MKRRVFGAFTLATGVALAVPPARAADVLTIGALGPLTGAGSAWGIGLVGGVELAADEVNAEGGLHVGGKTYQVKVVGYDEQYTAAGTITAYTRMVTQDGIKFIIGPISSVGTVAIKDMVEDNKTIIFTGGTSRKVIDARTKFLFRPFSTLTEYGGSLVRWLGQHQPADKRHVVLLNPNDETGWDGQEVEQAAYNGNGFKVVGSELYERTLKDFQPVLTKGRFIKMGGPGPRDIAAAAGKEAAEGMINALMADPANATYARLAAAFKAKKGFEPNEGFIVFYDATRVLLAAIQKAGSVTDSDKVRQAIAQVMPFRAAMGGEIALSGKQSYGADAQFVTVWSVGEIRNGEPVAVGSGQ